MKIVLISGKKMCKIVEKSHPDGRRTVVPVHGNEELGRGLLKEILKQIKLSRDEYEKLRQEV